MSFSCSLKWHVWVFINHNFTDDYSSVTVLFLDSQNGRTHCSRDPCPKGQCRSTLLIGASTSCCQACPGNQKWTCLNVSFWENVIRDLRMAKGEGDGLYSVSRTNLEGKLELFPCLAFLSKFRRHELILGLCIHFYSTLWSAFGIPLKNRSRRLLSACLCSWTTFKESSTEKSRFPKWF